MQKLLLFILLLSLNRLHAQTYTPFPDSGAVWVNSFSNLYWGEEMPYYDMEQVDNYCVNGVDTIVGSFSYTMVQYCGGAYKGALRDNGGQVFFVPKDSSNEYLLYDFTATVGTNLTNVYIHPIYGEPSLYDFTVSSLDSIIINGDYRTIVNLAGGSWIEGIGCTQGLFAEPWPNISDYMVDLECMSHNDTSFYPTFNIGSCTLDIGFTESIKTTSKISVFPNPTNSKFEILNLELNSNSTITIVNSLGQKINPEIITAENSIQVDLLEFTTGIYFVTIMNDGQFHSLKIIKQ